MIKLNKCIKSKVLKSFFYLEGNIKINSQYFIEKIKQGCSQEDNLNGQTNIKGKQTSWKYFNNDPAFLNAIDEIITCLDKNVDLPSYELKDSWGFSLGYRGKTEEHNHIPHLWSGALYLNSHNQTLDFNEIKRKVKPEPGNFVLFSAFLKHKCNQNRSKNVKWGISFNLSPR